MKDPSASKMDRRDFLKATGMGVAGVGMAGLLADASQAATKAAPPTKGAAPAGRSELVITPEKDASLRLLRWSGFVKSDEEVWSAHTKKWEELTGNKMLIEYVAWEDVRAKAAMAASVGAGPDIVMGWYDDPHLYPNKLIDLTDLCDYLGKKYGGWYPVFQAYGYSPTHRRWLGVPIGAPPGVQNYRLSWFKEAGYEKPPEKLDDLLTCMKKLKAIGHPAGYSFGHAVGDGNGVTYWLLLSFGGKTVEADNKTIAINRKETWDALEYGREFYEQLVPGVLSWLDPDNNKAFLSGQISLTRNAVSVYYAALTQFPDVAKDMGHANLSIGPIGRPAQIDNVSLGFIFKHTRFPNAAKHYLQFMMEQEQYGPWLTAMKGYVAQTLKAYEALPFWTSDPMLTIFRDQPPRMWPHFYAGQPGAQSAAALAEYIVVDMFQEVVTGRRTPKEAAKAAEGRLARIYRT
jgi:multiple sugar transport system substrate-binding protein